MKAIGQSAGLPERMPLRDLTVPAEVAFLSESGLPAADLAWAAAMAERTGVKADEWLIKEGKISEEVFYRALAAHVGLPSPGRSSER